MNDMKDLVEIDQTVRSIVRDLVQSDRWSVNILS